MAKSSIRGQTDSQLQESEKKYRQLIDTLQEGVWLIDKDANTTFVNPRMAEMLGYTVEAMLGQDLFAFIDEKNKELMQRKLQRRRQGIKESYDFEFICKDGHTIYVTLASSPIMDESGNYQGAIAVVTDVTERRLAEEALRESEERFRVTYEGAPVGITHVSPEGKWLHVNRRFCEMVGYSRKELLQRTFKDITYPDDLEANLKLLYQLLASEITTYSMEKRYIHKNGSLVWVNLTVTPVRDTTGEVKYIIGIIEDINERKQAEEALRQSEERFRTLVNSMDDIIFTLDREGRHTDVLGHWVEKAGLTPEVFLGKTVQEVLGNEAAIVHEAANQRALNGENVVYEWSAPGVDGVHYYQTSLSPIHNTSGVVGIVGVGRDITEVKLAEQRLADALDLNQKINSASSLGVLAYKASGACVLANEAAARITNATVEQLLQQNFRQIASWQQFGLLKIAEEALATGSAQRGEFHLVSTFGREIWMDNFFAPFTSGGESHLLFIINDITERKRAEQAEHEERILAEALSDTAAVLNKTLNIDEVLDRILTTIGQVVPHDSANITLIDEQGELRFVRAREYLERGLEERHLLSMRLNVADRPIWRSVVETHHPALISDTLLEKDWVRTPASWIRSFAAVPIVIKDRVVGFLSLDSATPGFFNQTHAERLQAFANQAAIAFENARLFAETVRRADQMAIVNRIGLAITSGLDIDNVARTLYEQCLQVADVDVFFLALFDKKTGMIYFPLFIDQGETRIMEPRDYESPDCLAGLIIRERKTEYIADTLKSDLAQQSQLLRIFEKESPRSFLGVPLILRDQVLGVLSIQSFRPDAYTPDHIRLMETIATQATIALENARLFEQMKQLAITDTLTGLYNRRHFFVLAENEIERALRYQKQLAMIMIDIDHFKTVNDTFGHAVGDRVLQTITGLCSQTLRKIDIMGRYGGEEFTIILPETNLDHALTAAERLRQIIESAEVATPEGAVKITASLGLAMLDSTCNTLELLLDCADKALYKAKQAGRNQVKVFNTVDHKVDKKINQPALN